MREPWQGETSWEPSWEGASHAYERDVAFDRFCEALERQLLQGMEMNSAIGRVTEACRGLLGWCDRNPEFLRQLLEEAPPDAL
jgi:hypothetical protein